MSDQITVIIPVCAMPSHPSSEVLDVTIDSLCYGKSTLWITAHLCYLRVGHTSHL